MPVPEKHTYLLCGVAKALSASNGSASNCITIVNNTGGDVIIKSLSIRYKPTLADCLIDIKAPTSKNDPLFFGQILLGGIGLPLDSPSQNEWKLPGRTQRINKGANLEFSIQTFAVPVAARDISLIVIVEEAA